MFTVFCPIYLHPEEDYEDYGQTMSIYRWTYTLIIILLFTELRADVTHNTQWIASSPVYIPQSTTRRSACLVACLSVYLSGRPRLGRLDSLLDGLADTISVGRSVDKCK